MNSFVKVTTKDCIQGKCGTLVQVNGNDVVIFSREGSLYATSNVCSHQHFSMLHKGDVDGFEVTCPMHGWKYDVRTGESTNGQGRIRSYKVRIDGNDVYIASHEE